MTMAGQRRLDHTVALLATAVSEGTPGHFIETGVWRGGMSFMAAKALEILASVESERSGVATPPRLTYLCDSFSGIPEQRVYGANRNHAHPVEGMDRDAHRYDILNHNSVARVKEDAALMQLGPTLRYVVGYFNESLPRLVRDEPSISFLTIRLDGDACEAAGTQTVVLARLELTRFRVPTATDWSTYEALAVLYPRLSPGVRTASLPVVVQIELMLRAIWLHAGGFVIIDDFTDWHTCRAAVDRYRAEQRITAPIVLVPHKGSECVRGAYWRKPGGAVKDAPLCLAGGPGAIRVAGSYNPGRHVPVGPPSGSWSSPATQFLQRAKYVPPAQIFMCIK